MGESFGPLSTSMRTTSALLIVSVVAEVIAIIGTPQDFQVYAAVILTPAIILNAIFALYTRRGKVWSYVGAIVVGIALLLIQVGISLGGDGGPPTGIEAFYIVLPALVSLKSYESILELKK